MPVCLKPHVHGVAQGRMVQNGWGFTGSQLRTCAWVIWKHVEQGGKIRHDLTTPKFWAAIWSVLEQVP